MDRKVMSDVYEAVAARWPDMKARFGLVLGSGWGEVAEAMSPVDALPYEALPGWGRTSVEGHAGRLLRVRIGRAEGLVFQGRRHWYEGEGWTPVALPIYVLKRMEAETVLLTNAAGGIRPSLAPGDLMVISDHINAMGTNPLIGAHDPFWGPRFPDQSFLYDPGLRKDLLRAARAQGGSPAEGIYLALSGPTYETPAEVRAWAALGADAVGMSTVPEAMLAHAAGLRVAGLSCITNLAAGRGTRPLSHDEVGETARLVLPRLSGLVRAFLEEVLG